MRRTNSLSIEKLRSSCHGLRRFNPISRTGLRFNGRETLRIAAVAAFLMAFGLSTFLISARGDDAPFITGIVRSNSPICLILYTNCSDTNFDYFVQSSTNLVNWVGSQALQGATTNTTVTCSMIEPGNQYFHRVLKIPHTNAPFFNMGLVAKTNIYLNGTNVLVDSFDSGITNYNPGGLYNPTNGIHVGPGTNVYSDPLVGDSNIVGIIRITNSGNWNFHYDEAPSPAVQ
jgi:hypothetical protein